MDLLELLRDLALAGHDRSPPVTVLRAKVVPAHGAGPTPVRHCQRREDRTRGVGGADRSSAQPFLTDTCAGRHRARNVRRQVGGEHHAIEALADVRADVAVTYVLGNGLRIAEQRVTDPATATVDHAEDVAATQNEVSCLGRLRNLAAGQDVLGRPDPLLQQSEHVGVGQQRPLARTRRVSAGRAAGGNVGGAVVSAAGHDLGVDDRERAADTHATAVRTRAGLVLGDAPPQDVAGLARLLHLHVGGVASAHALGCIGVEAVGHGLGTATTRLPERDRECDRRPSGPEVDAERCEEGQVLARRTRDASCDHRVRAQGASLGENLDKDLVDPVARLHV